ncbi:FKBP-type peptidyl-prolyl cis-trans isomerase [uncultured Porphyromonas sp.]|uniref:FKBP-type peptidyl-prolyl cis-trans isomerase n=1 Tax=uncultured Porphyromonas sp. TaxID=159274 RepID=UPI0025935533|nr:FKBP-type peptidyl-prolyl cis-trans isomerase [uncultured Porphyromonas sp.]
MKKILLGGATILFSVGMLLSSCGGKVKPAKFTNDTDSVSYAIGVLNASQMKTYFQQDSTIKLDDLIQGIIDGAYEKGGKSSSYMQGYGMGDNFRQGIEQDTTINLDNFIAGVVAELRDKSVIDQDAANKILQDFQVKMQQKQAEEARLANEKKVNAEKKILEELAADADVQKTESGLMYKVETMGTGIKPSADDTVTVHYKGTDVLGEVFDSSYDRKEPAEFPLNGVIKGWTEGFQLMPEGSKFTLWIPGNLAYGEIGEQTYGPTGLLKFECELIKVTPAKK